MYLSIISSMFLKWRITYQSAHPSAKQILRTTVTTLDEVAVWSGFVNGKNLICNFRRLTGLTPAPAAARGAVV
jgi:methylphosphotriester-DNA--protein-cysteine methyltransferase